MQAFSYRPWNHVKIKRNLIAGLFGLCGALITLAVYQDLKPQSTLATVDVTGLIHRFVKVEAAKSVSPAQMREQVKDFSQHLESVLQNLSREKHWVLLPKEAILSGCPDVTGEVEARLNTWENPHEPTK